MIVLGVEGGTGVGGESFLYIVKLKSVFIIIRGKFFDCFYVII